jgi:DNA-binding NtrC family response regulator
MDSSDEFLLVSKEILQLQCADFAIDTATTIHQALKALENKRYDVIISEYSFNDGTIVDVIKANHACSPIILFSFPAEETKAAPTQGVSGFVSKEGNPDKVFVKLCQEIKKLAEK